MLSLGLMDPFSIGMTFTSYLRNANVNSECPAAIDTYWTPSTMYVIGRGRHLAAQVAFPKLLTGARIEREEIAFAIA